MNITANLVIIIISIIFIFLTSDLAGWKKHLSWALAAVLFLSQCYLLYRDVVSEKIMAKSGKIESPISSSAYLQLYYGSNLFQTSASALTDEVLSHFITPWPKMDSFIRKENGKLLVDIIVRDHNGAKLAQLRNNEWLVSNDVFDRNFDDNKLEVFDKYENVPVLQIMLLEDIVVLNGVFYTENGTKSVATTEGLTINPTDLTKNTIKPWFKYPSAENHGARIDESVHNTTDKLFNMLKRHPK